MFRLTIPNERHRKNRHTNSMCQISPWKPHICQLPIYIGLVIMLNPHRGVSNRQVLFHFLHLCFNGFDFVLLKSTPVFRTDFAVENSSRLLSTNGTLPETNIDIAPENRPSRKETGIPTILFQVRTCC